MRLKLRLDVPLALAIGTRTKIAIYAASWNGAA